MRSLLLQSTPTQADLSMARYLIPRLITFITDTEAEDPEQARSLVAHSLSLYVGTLPKDQVSTAMALVIPTLMARATTEGDDLYRETSARLLELAAVDQDAFRSVVGALSSAQRALLEEVVRSGRLASANADNAASDNAQPTIALKMNFGG